MSDATSINQVRTLRNLYFTRTAVQLAWAAAVLATAVQNPALGASLLILYPLWDVACTVYDLRSAASTEAGPSTTQYVNAGAGLLAAIGIAATAFRSPQQAVVVFGAWALAAGLAQLLVGVSRRKQMGGQWAMVLSGLQSAVAGAAYIAGGLHNTKHINATGGYAILGGLYFLVAGILMQRKLGRSTTPAAAIGSAVHG